MPAKQVVDWYAAIKSLVTLVVGIIVSAVVLGAGWLVFGKIAPDLVEELTGTGLAILAGCVMIAVGLIMAATILSARK